MGARTQPAERNDRPREGIERETTYEFQHKINNTKQQSTTITRHHGSLSPNVTTDVTVINKEHWAYITGKVSSRFFVMM